LTTTGTSSGPEPGDLLPGYFIEPATGAWLTLKWPTNPLELPPSLGPAVIAALEARLIHHLETDPDGDPMPWRFHPSQRRFLWLWYAVRPDGRWLYRSGVKRGAKGTGKDPLIAAMVHGSLWGPTEFAAMDGTPPEFLVEAGWTAPWPRGKRHRLPLVQIAANSEGQGEDVLRVVNGMVPRDLSDELGWDPGILRSTMDGGGRAELLTMSVKSAEGDPATDIYLNESHHMTRSSGGYKLAEVARRNAAKSPGGRARVCEFTNAHQPGEGSAGEESFDAWQLQVDGKTRRQDILYDSREAPPHLRIHVEEELEEGITAAYSDSPWSDRERIRDEAQDPRVSVAESTRYYFNALPTNEDAWVDPRNWDRLYRELVVPDREQIVMFLDCSKSEDATVLDACRLSDGHIVTLGGWQRPHGDRGKGWLAPKLEVDAKVREARGRYQILWFGVDPSPARDDETEALYWGPLIDDWHRLFRDEVLLWASPGPKGSSVLFDMRLSVPGGHDRNRLFTESAMQTAADIDDWDGEGEPPLTHDGDPMMRVHVHNARRRPNQWGVSLGKQTRGSKNLVDHAVGMVGARMGRRLVLNSGKTAKKRTGVVRG